MKTPDNQLNSSTDERWFLSHKFLWSVIAVLLIVVVIGSVAWWKLEKQSTDYLAQSCLNRVKGGCFSDLENNQNLTGSTSDWKTYSNSQYGFELKYPSNWKVDSGVAAGEPYTIISYGDALNTPQIEIWPKGKGSGGLAGERRESRLDLTSEKESLVREYFESNSGQTFQYFLLFDQPPSSWEKYGFVSTNARISNSETKCHKKVDLSKCDPMIDGLDVFGSVNLEDVSILKKILSTFKFTDLSSAGDVSTWKTYKNDQFDFEFKYPSDLFLSEGSKNPPAYIITLGNQSNYLVQFLINDNQEFIPSKDLGELNIKGIIWDKSLWSLESGENSYIYKTQNIKLLVNQDADVMVQNILKTFKFCLNKNCSPRT